MRPLSARSTPPVAEDGPPPAAAEQVDTERTAVSGSPDDSMPSTLGRGSKMILRRSGTWSSTIGDGRVERADVGHAPSGTAARKIHDRHVIQGGSRAAARVPEASGSDTRPGMHASPTRPNR